MKKYITPLFLVLTVSLSAQTNSAVRLSLYAGAGIHSYAKPVYDRLGAAPTGSSWEAGVSFHRVMKKENQHVNKLYTGVRYENMNEYRIDHSSAGGTHYTEETDQRALHLRVALIHEHYLNKRYHLLFRFNSNFLLQQRHTGYIYTAAPGYPDTYSYFSNEEDDNRKSSYFTGGLGLGINLPYGMKFESLLEPGTSPHAAYDVFLGASINLCWNISEALTREKKNAVN